MGTSKSNIGPGNYTPLLPPWAPLPDTDTGTEKDGNENQNVDSSDGSVEDKGGNQENNVSPNSGNWTSARRKLGSYANNPTPRNLRGAARSYVRASGGAGNASKSAAGGRRVATRFGHFLNDIRNNGIQDTLSNLGLAQYSGESAEFILAKVADMLAPSGGLSEESIARSALLETLGNLCEQITSKEQDISSLERLNEENMALAIFDYISNYIYQRWLQELGHTLEKKKISEKFLIETEKEAKKLIYNSLAVETKAKDILKTNFSKGAGKKIIDSVFFLAYTLIEAL